MDEIDRTYYRMLLKTLLRLEDYADSAQFNLREILTRDVLDFWKAERNAALAEAKRESQPDPRASALAKLSPEERQLLGV